MLILIVVVRWRHSAIVMPITHVQEIGAENLYTRKTGVPISGASDMQFCTEFFWYRFPITKRTVLYFGAGFLVCVSLA